MTENEVFHANLVVGQEGNVRVRGVFYEKVLGVVCDDLGELFDPGRWASLTGDRLVMRRLDGGGELIDGASALYQETFTVADGLQLTPRLICRRRALLTETSALGQEVTRARALEYRLADQQSEGELIRVDQGSIVVREVPGTRPGVTITTTKRLRFEPPLDGPGLAITMGNLGYDEAFDDMVAAALRQAAPPKVAEHRATTP